MHSNTINDMWGIVSPLNLQSLTAERDDKPQGFRGYRVSVVDKRIFWSNMTKYHTFAGEDQFVRV